MDPFTLGLIDPDAQVATYPDEEPHWSDEEDLLPAPPPQSLDQGWDGPACGCPACSANNYRDQKTAWCEQAA